MNTFDKTIEGRRQLANFIPRLHVQTAGQIALTCSDIVEVGLDLLQNLPELSKNEAGLLLDLNRASPSVSTVQNLF